MREKNEDDMETLLKLNENIMKENFHSYSTIKGCSKQIIELLKLKL